MSTTARALHLIARPDGLPKSSDFALKPCADAPLDAQNVRIAVRYVSIDPAMRIWMSDQKSYWPPVGLGDVMRASALGEVVESTHPKFQAGQWVNGMFGVSESVVSDGRGVQIVDINALPDPSWALSAFGGTGLTAYFGLFDIGKPQAGETLVVSAAAGAVGSMVCQLAKAHGLRVIGIAGGADKCAYLRDTLKLDGCIDYKNEKVGSALSALCPDGIDIYFDNVGGEILDSVLKRLRLRARVVLCGGISQYNQSGPAIGPGNYLALISARARMEGFVVIDYLSRAAEAITAMLPLVQAGKITNKIDVLEGIENFPDALLRVCLGKNFGKQLLKL
jgi:NADPH-dependent curcumin reductase